MSERILRLGDVMSRTGLSRSSIYELVAAGELKKPITIGRRSVGWIESEVDVYIQRRIQLSRQRQGATR
ncbi:helix-turn-helix transcriptional regulator [Pseudoxanthomonas mexicana]